ncbi:restriction endonuclease subunit S [Corynebacterium timonense]|uniref:Type I restriction enzyme, S subunit n=2 Tax=Corynebacterium timonense TaxID=441500 RepID=A0A1H1V6H1_9CORY|nr:type I restriction enzyme, S subunit [Corynebacterium timonense]
MKPVQLSGASSYLLTPGNFSPNGGFQEGKPRFFDGPIRSDFVLEPGEILISMTDLSRNIDTLGSPMIVPEHDRWKYLHNQRLGKLVVKSENVDPSWLYHRLRMADYRHYIAATSTGTTVHHTSPSTISEFEFRLPPMPIQSVIGRLLRVLDDKIAANSHTVKMALQLQLAVWQTHTENADLIPLVEVAGPVLGGTPPRKDEASWNGGHKWASVADITASPRSHLLTTVETISDVAAKKKRFSPLPAGSVLLSARGTVGRVVSIVGPTSFNQSAYGFEAKPGFDAALRLAVMSAVKELRAKSHGSVFSTITKTQIQEALVPSVFSDHAQPLHRKLNTLEDLIVALERENLILAKTRDELLPLLMSGKITVKEAEQEATAAGPDIAGEESEA